MSRRIGFGGIPNGKSCGGHSLPWGAIDADQIPDDPLVDVEYIVYTFGQSIEIGVERAHNDTRMVGCNLVKVDKVPPIESKDGTLFIFGELEHILIRYCLTRFPTFMGCQDIMAQSP